MKHLISLTTMIAAVLVFTVSITCAAPATQPTDQAQVAPATQPNDTALPQGHPPLPQGHPGLPQGHPPVSGQPTTPTTYETTEVEPAWRVSVRHLIVRPMDGHLHVTEVWAVHNPTDRSYIGAPVKPTTSLAEETQPNATDNPDRITLVLPLSIGATQVQPGPEFHTCCVRVQGNKLISKMPMLPGTSEYRVDYLIPAKDGTFNLTLTTPAPTNHIMVFLPDDGSHVTSTGLETGDPFVANEQRYRMYTANQLDAGATVGLLIQAPQAPLESTIGADASTSQAGTIKLIAGAGAGLLVLIGAVVLLKPTKTPRPAGTAA